MIMLFFINLIVLFFILNSFIMVKSIFSAKKRREETISKLYKDLETDLQNELKFLEQQVRLKQLHANANAK